MNGADAREKVAETLRNIDSEATYDPATQTISLNAAALADKIVERLGLATIVTALDDEEPKGKRKKISIRPQLEEAFKAGWSAHGAPYSRSADIEFDKWIEKKRSES